MNLGLLLFTFLQAVLNIGGAALAANVLRGKNLSDLLELSVQSYFLLALGATMILVGFSLTLFILSRWDLTGYQPISSGFSYLFTFIIGVFFLSESVSLLNLSGVLFIAVGAWMVAS